ncbi:MAG: hypothetical protein M3Z33_01100, partial [Actinomycetota bacterium]|nr:hypothetical protein [Actinomycetota bacterium]
CATPRAVDALVALARRVGGDAVVPTFGLGSSVSPPAPAPTAVGADEVRPWIERHGEVREALGAIDDLLLFGAVGGNPAVALTGMQLGGSGPEPWLGDELADGQSANPLRRWWRPPGPRTLLVVFGDWTTISRGALVLDEFVEVLPDPTAITGLAVHYDAPNARPPQSILLAVHPTPWGQPWTWDLLERTVGEALDLARLRLVELEDLDAAGGTQYVPLTMVREGVPGTSPVADAAGDFTQAMVDAARHAR